MSLSFEFVCISACFLYFVMFVSVWCCQGLALHKTSRWVAPSNQILPQRRIAGGAQTSASTMIQSARPSVPHAGDDEAGTFQPKQKKNTTINNKHNKTTIKKHKKKPPTKRNIRYKHVF